MFKDILLVGLGGGVGCIFRYLLGLWITHHMAKPGFWLTITVNCVGCFLIGLLGGLSDIKGQMNDQLRLMLMTGLLGGFTTYSAFGYEAWLMIKSAQWPLFFFYFFMHILGCFIAVALGWKLSGAM